MPATVSVASTMTLAAPRTAKTGTRPVVKVSVLRGTSPAQGKVVVIIGAKKLTLTLAGGKARLKLPRLKAGKLKIVVRYRGNSSTTASSAKKVVRVTG